MKLSELFQNAGYDLRIDAPMSDVEIKNVCCDTRAVTEGSLFVALRGQHTDSHRLIGDAARRGAVFAVIETGYTGPCIPIPHISLSSTREALARLMDSFCANPMREMSLVGVTGTNGKTSVACLLSVILETAGRSVGTVGTVACLSRGRVLDTAGGDPEAHMTTPDPPVLYRMLAEMKRDGCNTVVMEATSHASALKKLAPLTFDLLIFTNLTKDHLDFHGTFEAYFNAKADLFRRAKRALVNLDGSAALGDPKGYARRIVEIARESGAEVRTCSADPSKKPDFLLSDFTERAETGITFRLKTQDVGNELLISSPLLGKYSGMNLLESAAAALMLGVKPESITSALGSYRGVPGRMERITQDSDTDISVLVDFAHTPDALENLLLSVRGFRKEGERISVLFGCGGDRDPTKRREMAHVASRLADLVYITSDNSRSEDPSKIIKDILRGIDKEKPYCVIPSREEAIRRAVLDARAGEILLLCGKGHERYIVDRNGTRPFCEADIVKAALKERQTLQRDRGEQA